MSIDYLKNKHTWNYKTCLYFGDVAQSWTPAGNFVIKLSAEENKKVSEKYKLSKEEMRKHLIGNVGQWKK